MREAARRVSSTDGSPKKKKSRSPKKAKFTFNLKSILRLGRHESSTRFSNGTSPIHTFKRTDRSLSDPVLRSTRLHDFGVDEEEKNDRESAENNTIIVQEDLAATEVSPGNGCNQDVAIDSSEAVAHQLSPPSHTVDGVHDPGRAHACAPTEWQLDDAVKNMACIHDAREANDEDNGSNHAIDLETEIHGDQQVQGSALRAESAVTVIEDHKCNEAPALTEELDHDPVAAAFECDTLELSTEALSSDDEVNDRTLGLLVRNEQAPVWDESTRSESIPIKENSTSTEPKDATPERSKFALGLYTIAEDDESVGDHLYPDSDFDAIPTTTTHRIRVGTLPGSPIRSPAKLAGVFEEEEMVDDVESNIYENVLGVGFHLDTFASSDIQDFEEVPTMPMRERVDELQGSSDAPNFTPTSPVELREAQDAGAWFPSEQGDILGNFEDGESTWTNCSSLEDDRGYGGTSSDHSEEVALYQGSTLSGEGLLIEMEDAEDRLDAAIMVVNEALGLANELLGVISAENAIVDDSATLVEAVQLDSDITGDDQGSIGLSFETCSDKSDEETVHVEPLANALAQEAVEVMVDGESDPVVLPLCSAILDEGYCVRLGSNIDHFDQAPAPLLLLQGSAGFPVLSMGVGHSSPFGEIYGNREAKDNTDPVEATSRRISGDRACDRACDKNEDMLAKAGQQDTGDLNGAEEATDQSNCNLGRLSELKTPVAREGGIFVGLTLLALVVAVIAGATVVVPSLVHLSVSLSQRCGTHMHLNLTSKCHDVWHAIATANQEPAFFAADGSPMKFKKSSELIRALPDLVESDVITACKLVVEMHTEEELAAAECGCLEMQKQDAEDEDCCGCANHERFVWKDNRAADDEHWNRYLLGLAFTLLVVAFLQYTKYL